MIWPADAPDVFDSTEKSPPVRDDLQQVRALLHSDDALIVAGGRVSLRVHADERAVLLAEFDNGVSALSFVNQLPDVWPAAVRHFRRALRLAELERSNRQLGHSEALQRALFAISELASSDLDLPDMLKGIHAIVGTLMYAENFFIVRHDAERDTLRFLYYADAEDTDAPDTLTDVTMQSREGSLTWHLITGGKALMGSAAQLRSQVSGALHIDGPHSVDWLGVPMLRDGQTLGALVVQTYEQGISFTFEDRLLLEFVGSHILTALERKQTKDELEHRVQVRTLELAQANRGLQQEVLERERAERLQSALFHIAQLATADIGETEFYESVHAAVGALINAENFFIALLSEDRRVLGFPYYVDEGARRSVSREVGRGLSEYVLRSGEPLLGTHAHIEHLGRSGDIDLQRIGQPAVCWLGVPLRVGDLVIGLVVVQSYREDVIYGPADQELLTFVALQIAYSIHRRRSAVSLQRAYADMELRVDERTRELSEQILQREYVQEQLKHQVMHDALTGLPNRGFLRERMDQVLMRLQREPGSRCALLYLDIDRFKVINDSLGHMAGDEMLKELGRRLQDCVREPDIVARLAGDEFSILLADVRSSEAVEGIAQRILDILCQPLQVAGRELQPSASIGIVIGDGSYIMADELLRDADLALYRAKERGRKRYEFFDESLANNVVDVLTLEGELLRALQRQEFEPYFQPIFRLASGQIVGYEALLRWKHPRDGVIGPSRFMKVAQDSGHIEAIDWLMFELSCRRFSRFAEDSTFLTLNVSALHVRHANFDRRLLSLLERTGVSPLRLIVEVTEGSLLDDPQLVRATLERLRGVGVGAALDDFGTGYSSLSYLHSLPLRMLKIDRSFVNALDEGMHATTTVVAAILALARALSIEVVAEGIETAAQRAALVQMGCEFGQGYLLGRPTPMEQWPDPRHGVVGAASAS